MNPKVLILKRLLLSKTFQSFALASSLWVCAVELFVYSFASRSAAWVIAADLVGIWGAFYWYVSRFLMGVDVDLKGRGADSQDDSFDPSKKRKSEIQLLLEQQNQLLAEISAYQDSVSGKIDEAKMELLEVTKKQLVGEISSTLVHDLRNPLASIMGYMDYLKEALTKDKIDRKMAEQSIEKLNFALSWMSRLVERMASFSAPHLEYQNQFYIQDVIQTVTKLLDRKITSQKIQLNVQFSPDFPVLSGNMGQIEQLFMNIISNAIDASQGKTAKVIDIFGEHAQDQVTVYVRDYGVGIPDENIENVLKPFFTTKQESQGTGLGLCIAHQIATRHGGGLQIKSRLGEGTSIGITLAQKSQSELSESKAA
jgi:two-component system NtrC family sensor kinase